MSDNMEKPRPQDEVAGTGNGQDITRPYIAGLMLPHDRVLSGRGGGDLSIYEQLLSDPQVKTVCEQRRNAVTQATWQVDAASDSVIDEAAAEFIRRMLHKIGFDRLTDLMLYCVFYGFSVAEILYEVVGGKLEWKEFKVRNRRRFRFDAQGNLRLLTPGNMATGTPCPAPYFWHIATGADNSDEPYGIGLGHWLYWPVLFKRNGTKFWMIFLEKFGMPTATGQYESGATPEEKRALLNALRAIQSDSGVIYPKGMEINLLEAARSGSADYKVLHETMDEAIAKAALGQTMTSQDGSSQAQANVHMSVRQDIIKSDSDLVCESFNLGPVKWLVDFNFAGAGLPRVYRMLEAEEDLDKAAETDSKIIDMGFKPSLEYVREKYGEHWEEKVLAPIDAAVSPEIKPVPGNANFAELIDPFAALLQTNSDRQDVLVESAAVLASEWEKFVGPQFAELQTLLDETQDLDLFSERLIELADNKPNEAFVLALQKAGFGAQLLARVPKQ